MDFVKYFVFIVDSCQGVMEKLFFVFNVFQDCWIVNDIECVFCYGICQWVIIVSVIMCIGFEVGSNVSCGQYCVYREVIVQ